MSIQYRYQINISAVNEPGCKKPGSEIPGKSPAAVSPTDSLRSVMSTAGCKRSAWQPNNRLFLGQKVDETVHGPLQHWSERSAYRSIVEISWCSFVERDEPTSKLQCEFSAASNRERLVRGRCFNPQAQPFGILPTVVLIDDRKLRSKGAAPPAPTAPSANPALRSDGQPVGWGSILVLKPPLEISLHHLAPFGHYGNQPNSQVLQLPRSLSHSHFARLLALRPNMNCRDL